MKFRHSLTLCAALLAMPLLAQEVTYRKDIAPVLKTLCADCHGDSSPPLAEFLADQEKFKKAKQGPRTSSYGDVIALVGWPDAGAFMRRLDDGSNSADKKPGNMHQYLGDTDAQRAANLRLLKAWVGEGAWNLNRWEKRGETPAVTKEQMDRLRLKY